MNPPRLSIVFGTLNRLSFLKRALTSIYQSVGDLAFEIIVVDGGSTDGTVDYLQELADFDPRCRVVELGERTGAVKAFNAGFAAARGEYVAALNDDCEVVGDTLKRAVEYLDTQPKVGQLAIPYRVGGDPSALYKPEEADLHVEYVKLPDLGRVVYANFGVIRRTLGARLGWWGNYYTYGGDTELSCKVWKAGYRVEILEGGEIIHYQVQDDTRVPNVEQKTFNARWRPQANIPPPARGQTAAPPAPAKPPPSEPGMIRLRYIGDKHGSNQFRSPHANRRYVVSVKQPYIQVTPADASWLLKLREHGRAVFEKVE